MVVRASRSVTAYSFDAPGVRVARRLDWFRLATCVLIGELGFPLERFVLFGS
jgi:hypothetical protein